MAETGATTPEAAMVLFLQDVERYCDLHIELFGKYDYHVGV